MKTPEEQTLDLIKAYKDIIEKNLSLIETASKKLEIKNITFEQPPEADDYEKQKETLNKQESYSVKFKADVILTDKKNNKVLDKANIFIGYVPICTNRFSYIINGKEYIVHNQTRLRPGVYSILDKNGNATVDFNLKKGANISFIYVPVKEQIQLEIGNSHILGYVFFKDIVGLTDSELIKVVGSDLHKKQDQMYKVDRVNDLNKLFTIIQNKKKDNQKLEKLEDMITYIQNYFATSEMDSKINEMTLGIKDSKISKNIVLASIKELLDVYADKKEPTRKDSLAFKEILGPEDHLVEKFSKNLPELIAKLKIKIGSVEKIADLNLAYYINNLTDDFFVHSDLVNFPLQINPMEMLENAQKITSMGEGGIGSVNAIPLDLRDVHTSELGFIDPVRTPDNIKAGIDKRISIGVKKIGRSLYTEVINKSGKKELKSPEDLYFKHYSFIEETPDEKGLYKAIHKGSIVKVKKDQIDYWIQGKNMFTYSTTSVPFINATHPQRAAMGAKMLTQSLSLVDRELPLVSSQTADAFEKEKSNTIIGIIYAKEDGVVSDIKKNKIIIKNNSGKEIVHNYPNNFALNYHSYLDSTPIVKIGDKVKKGQPLTESNFTKNGKLALGINLKVAFLPYKGYNYEDAIVVTESAAKKLSSTSVYPYEVYLETPESLIINTEKYKAYFPGKYTIEQLASLENGVVKKGHILHNGDPIILIMKAKKASPEVLETKGMVSRIINPYTDLSYEWDKDYPGEVIEVSRDNKYIKVVVKATTPLVVGDKLCNRYGGKGVVSLIIPDNEAPRDEKGEPIEVMLNPAGLPSRKNTSQVLETLLAKVIKEKNLDPKDIPIFDSENHYEEVKKFLEKHGVKDTETLIDPESGESIEGVMTGYQYFLKLFKQTESSFAARAGGKYDMDLRPVKGGEEGAKNLGNLEFYGYLAHEGGSKNLLREMATYKAEFNPEFWRNILTGQPPPPPKPTFVYEKFITMLKGMGINVEKKGNTIKIMPFTDKDILKMSNGEIQGDAVLMNKPDPETGLPFRPEKGGLFDPAVTGGLAGKYWNHIKLVEPMINPMMLKPVRYLLDLKEQDLDDYIDGKKFIEIDGQKITGGKAIEHLLKQIDVEKSIEKYEEEMKTATSLSKKDTLIKKLKYLKALKSQGLQPNEAYVMNYVPVIPPAFRQVYPDDTGKVIISDINYLYADLIRVNNALKSDMIQKMSPTSKTYSQLRRELYNSIERVQGLDKAESTKDSNKTEPVGFLKTITGSSQVKYGYFQSKLLSRAQDIVGRGVISVKPDLDMDTIGIPEPMAWTLYGPMVMGNLIKNGYSLERATEEIKNRTQHAKNILLTEMESRPVIAKRDPILHKFGILSFKPKLVQGKHIEVPAVVTSGFGADFDGDTFTIHVPISNEAIKDAQEMFPSKNLFSPMDKSVVHVPGQECIQGLYKMTKPKQETPIKIFSTKTEALLAFKNKQIKVNDHIVVKNVEV